MAKPSARAAIIALGLVLAAQVATAQPAAPPAYPDEITERPVMLPDGMNEMSLDLLMPTYMLTSIDPTGTTTTRKSSLGEYLDLEASLRHSFGLVEVHGEIGFHLQHPSDRTYPSDIKYGAIRARIGSEPHGDGVVGFTWIPTSGADEHFDLLYAGYEYKWHVIPDRLAFYANSTVNLTEYAIESMPGVSAMSVHTVALNPSTDAELELTHNVGIYFIGALVVPLEESSPTASDKTTLFGGVQLQLSRRAYDLFAFGGVQDVTNHRLPEIQLGATLRP